MTGFVIDATAFAPFIIPDEAQDLIPGMVDLLMDKGAIAPQHWPLEVANLAIMCCRRNRISELELPIVLGDARNANVRIDDATADLAWGRTVDLAMRHCLTIYDAAYLELAIRLDLPLATLDKALAAAAREHVVR
ncbi:MAG: hypothetical protein RL367_803, partial [Pseudomonadota bacterium]